MFALLQLNPIELLVCGGGFVVVAVGVLVVIYLVSKGNSKDRRHDDD